MNHNLATAVDTTSLVPDNLATAVDTTSLDPGNFSYIFVTMYSLNQGFIINETMQIKKTNVNNSIT